MVATLQNILSGLMVLGVAQGLLLGFQLFQLRARNPFGYFNLLLGVCAVTAIIAEQWFVFTDAWRNFPHIIRATSWAPFLIGPTAWLFVRSLDRPGMRAIDLVHYAPAAAALAFFIPFYLQSGEAKIAFVDGTNSIPIESSVLGVAKAASMIGYLLAVRIVLGKGFVARGDRLTGQFRRAVSLFLAFLLLLLLVFGSEHILGELPVSSDTLAAIGAAVFFYSASAIAMTQWRDFAFSLAPASTGTKPATLAGAAEAEKLLDEATALRIYEDMRARVLEAGLYREPSLKIDALAERLGLPSHYLSFVINRGAGRNVQAWLNSMRIEAAQAALLAEPKTPVLDIGLAAGFNSKASFNRAFKTETGMTPSEFRARSASQIAI
ncbi:MAG TPA: helix-turn-helix domain-containing protein [Parvularculaceae bacterium]|nr:helix-turn-helix domain-containing protein [Parvularculaceae bacterium]HRX40080.1 helix-turn-helix domain-containing protein [Parvularculaceae bacterium]